MPEIPKDEKTEEPTERRLSKSREEGRTAKSIEVNTVFVITTALVFFTFFSMNFIENVLALWREMFGSAAEYEVSVESIRYLLALVMSHVVIILAPLLLAIAVMGIVSNVWQNDGWIFSFKPLAPKFNKLNPLTGLKKFLGVEGLNNLVKSLVKLTLVGGAVYLSMFDELEKAPILMLLPVGQTLTLFGEQAFALVLKVLAVLVIIAFADFVFQKYSFKKGQRMTKKEVKDERKDIDGDPITKSRIRQKQFEWFRSRMMTAVPEAEVIITNPTHLSIALRYNKQSDAAPICVGKGSGYVALKIREIAKEHDIPIMEDKPLAQTLFKTVEIGGYIPETLYKAVAEILAYVYRLKMKMI